MSPPAPQTDAIPPVFHCHWSHVDAACLNVAAGQPPRRQWTWIAVVLCRHEATASRDTEYRKAGFELPLFRNLPCAYYREVPDADGGLRR